MPNALCDLHLHSYYSDGRASPADLLHHAVAIGLKTVSITDHDTVAGQVEASHVAAELGLELVPGIELTSRWDSCMATGGLGGQDVDILGYYIDTRRPEFLKFTQAALEDIRQRMAECCSYLTQAGYPVTIYDVEQENPRYPGAMQLITTLWRKGHAGSWNQAFPLFNAQWPKVRSGRFSTEEVIQAIHAAGGVAVLAHPVAVQCEHGLLSEIRIGELVEMGLDGLEVLHPRLDLQARAHFNQMAKRFNLVISGGSDEHGWAENFPRMGSELVTYEMVRALEKRSKEVRAERA